MAVGTPLCIVTTLPSRDRVYFSPFSSALSQVPFSMQWYISKSDERRDLRRVVPLSLNLGTLCHMGRKLLETDRPDGAESSSCSQGFLRPLTLPVIRHAGEALLALLDHPAPVQTRRAALSTHNIMRNRNAYCLKPLQFGAVCYAATAN